VLPQNTDFSPEGSFSYDLTHPPEPTSPANHPRIPLQATAARVSIDPTKNALMVVNLLNYFLSQGLGCPSDAVGLYVVDKLSQYAIPAYRKAGIQIIWLNWGLTEEDINEMPPNIVNGFTVHNSFDGEREIKSFGSEVGSVRLDDGSVVDGGRVLMRDR